MILRLVSRLRRPYLRPPRRRFSTEAPIPPHSPTLRKNPSNMKPFPLSSSRSLISSPNPKSLPLVLVSGTLISTLAVAAVIYKDDLSRPKSSDRFYADLEETLEKSKNSLRRVFDQMSQTAAAAAVLWKSLASVMSSANQEMRSGFEFRVAALLADIAAASGARRSAIVGASGGAVVDWLLETVGTPGRDRSGTREEAARALAYLVADPGVCESVLGRPGAVPNLLRFIFWFQPKGGKKYKNSSLDSPGLCKGRSMLVAALMDIVTSNCDTVDFSAFQPLLPGKADMRDIAAALEVVEEGGIHLDDQHGEKDDDGGDKGMKGIGIKVLGGTTILGFSKTNDLVESDGGHLQLTSYISRNMALRETSNKFLEPERASITVPGLWDDLQREHVAVPFAAWALANWALASEINRSHIQELDRDGHAIMTALTARERTVKWHGSLVARALLDDQNLPLTFSVPSWSSSLLSTAFHASKVGDISLAQVALSAFVVSAERSDDAKKAIMGKGLHLMREITKQAERHRNLQELLARVLELLYAGNMHLSVEEAQRWSGTLLRWIFGASASDSLRISATKILSFILEDYGPASIPISQGWLTICLNEIIETSKISALNGSTPLKTDKTQIDQSNALSAAQVVNQLATAVIKLASNQLESESDSVDKFSFADLLSLEPFAPLFRSMKKTNMPKFDAADSALATLKSVKALSELCSGDVACQNKLADFGILCLLRRLLLSDDYENLAAIEAYDASRALEMQDRGSAASSDSSSVNSNDSSSVRVPPTAHIRRHAARLLRILSLLPKVKKAIIEDKDWCKWLEDCANGRIPCCNDLKTQSNARATLLNIFCSDQADTEEVNSTNPGMEGGSQKTKCAQYQDMIFLINPELPHWKCPEKNNLVMSQDLDVTKRPVSTVYSSPSDSGESIINENSDTSRFLDTSDSPLLDIIFIHGLRGGPFKSWRIADNKSSTTSKAGLVEHIDQEAGREGTCWPREWLSADFPYARLLTVKYKTNLTQWSGASLPLQEVSSMLLQKLVAAGIGDRPVVFITHSMGGLVVKQMLYQAKISNFNNFVNNTIGVVFYSCPHFGSKLADMPWRMGMVFRPAPTIGELRSGSPRLVELNDFIRYLHKKGHLEVLSFSETQVTPIVEGYGGWAFRMEIVPIESAYPGFGELVVLDGTDHINSCKPVNRTDPSYSETLDFLKKLRARLA